LKFLQLKMATLVREMSECDLTEVVEIEGASRISRWGRESYAGELARRDAIVLVAVESETSGAARQVKGFIAARVVADELQINNFAVRAEDREKGVGSALLRAAMTESRRRGAQSAFLEVRESNLAARRFYAQHGFTVCGRRKNYYREPPEDALLLCAKF
jgi:ribosomal-protein-alanine N-acetyltransferase